MELIVFLAVLGILYFFGEWAVRKSDESKRAHKARQTESMRVRNNSRLTKTDCYVYLFKRVKYPGQSYESTYLKIGIGVEDRVRLQLKEPNTQLIKLLVFRVRDDAFEVEQKVLKAWNNKILGDISTFNRSMGTEYIAYSEKDLQKALDILNLSSGVDVTNDSEPTSTNRDLGNNEASSHPSILDRTLVYLLHNHKAKLIKVGMGTFDRPDSIKGSSWEISRFCHFENRTAARLAEQAVLKYWRNELKMEAPERAKNLLKSGHTETVDSKAGIAEAWRIIRNSPGFVPLVTDDDLQIWEQYEHYLAEGMRIWPDSEFWLKIRVAWYGSVDSKIWEVIRTLSQNQHIRSDTSEAKRELNAFAKRFQEFMNTNHGILERIKSAKIWDSEISKHSLTPHSNQSAKTVSPRVKKATPNQTERFWAKVDKTETCWIWKGAVIESGYGIAVYDGKNHLAHRAAWIMEKEEIAKEVILENTCGNRVCVRPSHWQIGERRRSELGEVRISPFVCTTPGCEKPSDTMTKAGPCDGCKQRAKRQRRKLREQGEGFTGGNDGNFFKEER
jgi:hypothetical protein